MKKRFYLFTAIIVSLVLFNACQSEMHRSEVEDARKYFEQTASALSLPLYNVPSTKAQDIAKYTQSVTPLWEEAVISEVNGRRTIEIPLTGPVKIVGIIVTRQQGKEEKTLAATKSYLVMEYAGEKPEMYVETFLQRGKGCTMMKSSARDGVTGIEIRSYLDGTIFSQTGFDGKGEHEIEICEDHHHHHGEMHDAEGFDSIGYSILYNVLSTKGGCPLTGFFYCYGCWESFYVDGVWYEDIRCPYCGTSYMYNYREYCPQCGMIREKCECKEETCAPCGQRKMYCASGCGDKGVHCPCEVGIK